MVANLIISFFLLFLTELSNKKNKRMEKIIIVGITMILGLYYRTTASDWVAYRLLYENVLPKLSLNSILNSKMIFNMDRGFVLLSYFFYKLTVGYNIFQALIIGSCTFFLLYFIKDRTSNFYIAIIFLLSNFFNLYVSEPILRQLIAITIIVYGVYYIENKKFFKYIITVLIATQFHLSAIICICFYFLNYIKIDLKRSIFIFILGFLLFLNIEFLFKGVTVVFPSLSHYYSYIKYNSEINKSFFNYIRIIFLISMYIICLNNKKNKINNVYIGITLGYLILLFNKDKFFLLGRLDGYFLIPVSIYFSNIDMKKKFLKIIFNIFNILLLCHFLNLNKDTLEYNNYLTSLLTGKQGKKYIEKEREYNAVKKEIYNEISSISK